ncbi:MAG: hypothetical protein F9K27_14765 [Anaerolineae bacterium]|nr:MAG: hypothetical protein F9K27_14765 [Anaerolineae bacterium]
MTTKNMLAIFALIIGILGYVALFSNSEQLHTAAQTDLPPFPTATSLPAFPTATPLDVPTFIPTNTSPARTATAGVTEGTKGNVVLLTCHAEPKWSFLVNVRRGPGPNWGITRQLVHNTKTQEMRVFGRTSDNRWYHVVLPEPYQNEVGWAYYETLNVFGVCDDLPVTEENPEITFEDVPPIPEKVPLPPFASNISLSEYDRAFLVKPGILYIRRDITGGDPLQAHVLVMDLTAPQMRIGGVLGAVPDVKAVTVSEMVQGTNAFAALNGDYYGGNYMPQNLTIINGEIISAPKHRATFAVTKDGKPLISYFTLGWTWPSYVVAKNQQSIPLQLMNLPCNPVWLCLYSWHLNNRLPVKPNAYDGIRVLLDHDFRVVDIFDNVPVDIPDGHYVLRGGDETGKWLLDNVEVGDQLQVNLVTEPDWRNFETAIGGGPRIILNGEFWQDCDPTEAQPDCEEFDERHRNRHYYDNHIPRSAIGYNQDGTVLYAVVVEGYEVDDSGGATQRELADMMIAFGAYQAMEYDGGGSATLWMRPNGPVNDFGYEGERPIANAVVFYWEEE